MKCFKPYLKSICSLCMLIIISCTTLLAQERAVEMADIMRSNGKIYIVVAVVVTILIGIIIFIMNTERKVKQLENKIEEMKSEK